MICASAIANPLPDTEPAMCTAEQELALRIFRGEHADYVEAKFKLLSVLHPDAPDWATLRWARETWEEIGGQSVSDLLGSEIRRLLTHDIDVLALSECAMKLGIPF